MPTSTNSLNPDFEKAFLALICNEDGSSSGYVDNPNDPGGATCHGVTERVARKWGYMGDMHDLPINVAKQIAKSEYWDPYQCDKFGYEIGFQVFDAAYNGGYPATWLQHAANVTADGDIGPQTIAAVQAADPDEIVMRFDAYRLIYLGNLKIWPAFGHGWANRIANNLLRAAQ